MPDDRTPRAGHPTAVDERDELLAALARQRDALRVIAYGLTDEQAATLTSRAGTSIRTLIEQATRTERQWVGRLVPAPSWPGLRATWAVHRSTAHASLSDLLREYACAAVETAEVVAGVGELAQVVVAVGEGSDREGWTARRVLLHVVEDTARLAGLAAMVREGIDGTSFVALTESTAA